VLVATAEVEVEAVVEKEEEEVVSNQIGVPICLHNVSQSEIKACREPGAFGSLLPRLIHTSMVVIPFVQLEAERRKSVDSRVASNELST